MKVDQRALAGIDRKITRAEEHFRSLYREMAAWEARGPWRFLPEEHDEGRKHFYRLELLEPIPIDWAVILGEAVHDLRSALDQSVYWLTVDWEGRELAGTSFPVYTRTANFYQRARKSGAWSSSGGMYKIRGIGPGPHAFIEALQPYPQRYRRRYCVDLRIINNLWNQDKHRLVHLWGLRFSDVEAEMPAAAADRCTVGVDSRVLHDGAIVVRIFCDPPHPKVKVRGQIISGLSFYGGKGRNGVNLMLWDVYTTIADIVRKLRGAVGRQHQAINLDIWTEHSGTPRPPPPPTHRRLVPIRTSATNDQA